MRRLRQEVQSQPQMLPPEREELITSLSARVADGRITHAPEFQISTFSPGD